MTTTADHDREPLPLSLIGWGVTLTMFAFGAWGYLLKGGFFEGLDNVDASGAGLAVLAVLSGIMQGGAALGAKALRRSKNFDLDTSKFLSGVVVVVGAIVTGCAIHNALELAGMDPVSSILIAIGVPVCEFCVWWIDESLVSEAAARRAADEAQRLADIKPRPSATPPGPLGMDLPSVEWAALSDEAIEAAISACASGKKFAENERARRRVLVAAQS